MSRIDVIVPCYNYARFLTECVESVLSQDILDLRVLILDDASSDNTPEVAACLAARDSRVEYRRHAINRGHISTFNEGLEWANGDYELLLSADDLLTPCALERALSFLDAHPKAGMVYGRSCRITGEAPVPELPAKQKCVHSRLIPGAAYLEAACRDPRNPILSPTVVVRTALRRQVGGYRKELSHTNDMEMWMRIAVHSDIGFINAPQAIYRWHGRNMSAPNAVSALADLRFREAAFSVLFREQGRFIRDCERLRKLAADSLARDARQIAEQAFLAASDAFDRGDPHLCRTLLTQAAAADRNCATPSAWRRMRVKRILGPRLCSFLRWAKCFLGLRNATRGAVIPAHPEPNAHLLSFRGTDSSEAGIQYTTSHEATTGL